MVELTDRKEKRKPSNFSEAPTRRKIGNADQFCSTKERRRWSWLEESGIEGKKGFSYPQVIPSLLLHEEPSSLDHKVPIVPGPKDVVTLSTTTMGTKVSDTLPSFL